MAAAARVSRARRLRVEAGVQRRSTALFIGPGEVALACAPREGYGEACPGRTRLRVRAAHGREESPDGRGLRGSDGERGEAEWAGERRWAGAGWFWAAGKKRERERERAGEMVFWAAGKKRKEKRKIRDGPAGLNRRGEKGRLFHF